MKTIMTSQLGRQTWTITRITRIQNVNVRNFVGNSIEREIFAAFPSDPALKLFRPYNRLFYPRFRFCVSSDEQSMPTPYYKFLPPRMLAKPLGFHDSSYVLVKPKASNEQLDGLPYVKFIPPRLLNRRLGGMWFQISSSFHFSLYNSALIFENDFCLRWMFTKLTQIFWIFFLFKRWISLWTKTFVIRTTAWRSTR